MFQIEKIEGQALSVQEFCDQMKIGKTLFYKLKKQNAIHVFKLGNKNLVPVSELDRLINQ